MATKMNQKPMAEGASALQRLQTLAPERREQLLGAATAAFAENGFSAASMNAILKTAGVSKGQAYYYVYDKADLYRAVIEHAFSGLAKRFDFAGVMDCKDTESFWQGINGAFEGLAELLVAEPVLAALGRSMYEGGQTEEALKVPFGRLRAGAAILVEHGQTLGAIRTDMPQGLIIEMLFAAARALDRWFAENWDQLTREESLMINAQGLAMIRAMVAPQADLNRTV